MAEQDAGPGFEDEIFLEGEAPTSFGEQIADHLGRTRLAALFLQSPAFMAITRGPDHVFVNANPTYYELVGSRELIGRSVRDAFPELEGQGFFETLDQVYETGEAFIGSEEPVDLVVDDEWERAYVCFSYHPLTEDGEVWGTLVHGIDVTERVRQRKSLEYRLRAQTAVAEFGRKVLSEHSLDAIFAEGVRTAIEATGADAGELVAYRPDDGELLLLAGEGWPEDDLRCRTFDARGDHHLAAVLRDRRPHVVRSDREDRAWPVSPSDRFGAHVAVPVPGSEEAPNGILGVHAVERDAFDEGAVPALEAVAHVLGTAAEREEYERFIATVTSNLPGILYRCRNDRDWTMEFVSDGVRELTGYGAEDLLGDGEPTYADLIHPDDRDEVWRGVQEALERNRPFQLQYRIRTRDGEEKWVWEQGRGVQSEPHERSALEGCMFDITDQWRQERELERSRELLQRYARHTTEARETERRDVAREIHDELGQRLTALRMRLDGLSESLGPELPEARDELEESLGLVDSTLEKVRDLTASLRPAALDDLGLVDALSQLVRTFGERTGLETSFEVDEEVALPPESSAHVYRVIQEALTNAARHADPQEVRVVVSVGDGRGVFRVLDDGRGLEGDPLASPDAHGVLGMYERADILEGELAIRDRPEGGTEVALSVPLAD